MKASVNQHSGKKSENEKLLESEERYLHVIQNASMDGYEVTRQIRKFNKEVVIIAQTAYGPEGDKAKAIDAGCNDYISKPVDTVLLIKMIKNILIK